MPAAPQHVSSIRVPPTATMGKSKRTSKPKSTPSDNSQGQAPESTATARTAAPPKQISTQPLSPESFAPYGDVIAVPSQSTSSEAANQGTAQRYNYLTQFTNYRSTLPLVHPRDPNTFTTPANLQTPPATPNLCIFRSFPTPHLPFPIKLLERHKWSTQMFVPMTPPQNGARAYLLIVALTDKKTDKPDWSTLKSFVATSTQGFNYHASVWHHPMIALDAMTDFVCLVWERRENMTGPSEDTEEILLDDVTHVHVPGFKGAADNNVVAPIIPRVHTTSAAKRDDQENDAAEDTSEKAKNNKEKSKSVNSSTSNTNSNELRRSARTRK
ncbi:ureidoglycolate lyase [Synchytrium endobioticum]|uniref:Ureidoglycolate lyase n=1 Tax=Synchytrium endobioticum TaxID=286115 RepID=A0A507CXE9_9FUNG|nr:ureidoglycolate lyase [Synchytrium endobioticum]TPX47908.1 ureidoglycolate lyase [Synchytrium endobioticum]